MTPSTALLFYDNDAISPELANTYIKALNLRLTTLKTSRTVNFYSSKYDDLALVSRYRVVSLPTLIITDTNNHILVRCSTFLPVVEDVISAIL